MSDKKRVDVALVERGLAQSRGKGTGAGDVRRGLYRQQGGQGYLQVTPEDELIVRQTGTGYVSRGALKLEKGLAVFGVEAKERVAMDLGASTVAALRTCCCKTVRRMSMPSTWATASWIGSCATTRA